VATSEAESDRSVDESPRSRSPARSVQPQGRHRHLHSERRGRVRRCLGTSNRRQDGACKVSHGAWSRDFRAASSPAQLTPMRLGSFRPVVLRTLNSRAAAIRRRSDDLGVDGKSAPVGSALSYVILRRGGNRGTSDAVRRNGPRPSQSLRARRRRPSKTLCHAQPKNLVRGTSIVRSHPATDDRRSGV